MEALIRGSTAVASGRARTVAGGRHDDHRDVSQSRILDLALGRAGAPSPHAAAGFSGRVRQHLSPVSAASDLDAYFARIGYDGPRAPTLATLHAITAAHTSSIPFENLSILMGEAIDLEIDAVMRKLVHARRGGYCFEQNGLLLHVLGALGFEVTPLGARVRLDRPRDFIPPRTHVFLRVDVEGEPWITDVGVGGVSLTSAIRLDTEAEQTTPHDCRRIVRDSGRLFHQVRFGDDWQDVCEFTLEEMPPVDRELGNWFTSAHPRSHFKNRLIVARAASDGSRLTLLNDELKIRRRGAAAEKRLVATADELLDVLGRHFGLSFPPGTRFGPAGSPWPT
jgi:N-hydroxyarylamine O-acetyltransferase